MRRAFALAFALALAVMPLPVLAQDGGEETLDDVLHVEPDRPVVIRAQDVEKGRHQVEINFKYDGRKGTTQDKFHLPVSYRIDTGPDTEFRLTTNGLTWQEPNLGFSDLIAGFKWNFQEGPSAWAIAGYVEFPSGSAGLGDPELEPGVVLVFDQQLDEAWQLTLNAGAQSLVDGTSRRRYLQGAWAGQVARSLDEDNRVSLGMSGFGPDADPDGIHRVLAHLGFTHNLDPNTQMGLTVSRGLSLAGTDWGVTLGWSHRY